MYDWSCKYYFESLIMVLGLAHLQQLNYSCHFESAGSETLNIEIVAFNIHFPSFERPVIYKIKLNLFIL